MVPLGLSHKVSQKRKIWRKIGWSHFGGHELHLYVTKLQKFTCGAICYTDFSQKHCKVRKHVPILLLFDKHSRWQQKRNYRSVRYEFHLWCHDRVDLSPPFQRLDFDDATRYRGIREDIGPIITVCHHRSHMNCVADAALDGRARTHLSKLKNNTRGNSYHSWKCWCVAEVRCVMSGVYWKYSFGLLGVNPWAVLLAVGHALDVEAHKKTY